MVLIIALSPLSGYIPVLITVLKLEAGSIKDLCEDRNCQISSMV